MAKRTNAGLSGAAAISVGSIPKIIAYPAPPLSANQIEFIDLIVNHLTEHGAMDAGLLYESPFTDLAPRGPDELFTSAQLDELFGVLDEVRKSALAG
jgi:EcoEI R protein C-terminal